MPLGFVIWIGPTNPTLVKIYGPVLDGERRYSSAECLAAEKRSIQGNPDPAHISTSYIERQNLTMRMSMRRFTRITNGFSRKIENPAHALLFPYHKPYPTTPAMAAGLTDHAWSVEEIVMLLDLN